MDRLACVELLDLPERLREHEHRGWRGEGYRRLLEEAADILRKFSPNVETAALRTGACMSEGAFPKSACHDNWSGRPPAGSADCLSGARPGTDRRHQPRGSVRATGRWPVRPVSSEPGIFFMDVSGLRSLYKTASQWVAALSDALLAAGHAHRIAVGFTHFGVYAAVKNQLSAISHQPSAGSRRAGSGQSPVASRQFSVHNLQPPASSLQPVVRVFRSPAAERAAALRVRLERFPLPLDALMAFKRLGVLTVGDLLALPADDLLARYDDQVYRFHRFASGELDVPLSPQRAEEEISTVIEVDPPDDNATRLLFMVKEAMPSLFTRLAANHRVAAGAALEISFGRTFASGTERWTLKNRSGRSVAFRSRGLNRAVGSFGSFRGRAPDTQAALPVGARTDQSPFGHAGKIETVVRLARPSREESVLLDLIRLRLDTLELPDLVHEIRVALIAAEAEPEQLLLTDRPARDLAAAESALARLRTEFGDHAVVRARLRERHLPEHRFVWEPVARVVPAQPIPSGHMRTLVRRLYQPSAFSLQPSAFAGGPFRLSGGWWRRPVERDYYFVETRHGEVLWVFYDRVRRRWFVQGRVE
jgi:protein ImuB